MVIRVALAIAVAAAISVVSRLDRVTGDDASFVWDGHPVQFEYARCLAYPGVVWYEDGSASC